MEDKKVNVSDSTAPLIKEDCEVALVAREKLTNDDWTRLIFSMCQRARQTANRKVMN